MGGDVREVGAVAGLAEELGKAKAVVHGAADLGMASAGEVVVGAHHEELAAAGGERLGLVLNWGRRRMRTIGRKPSRTKWMSGSRSHSSVVPVSWRGKPRDEARVGGFEEVDHAGDALGAEPDVGVDEAEDGVPRGLGEAQQACCLPFQLVGSGGACASRTCGCRRRPGIGRWRGVSSVECVVHDDDLVGDAAGLRGRPTSAGPMAAASLRAGMRMETAGRIAFRRVRPGGSR